MCLHSPSPPCRRLGPGPVVRPTLAKYLSEAAATCHWPPLLTSADSRSAPCTTTHGLGKVRRKYGPVSHMHRSWGPHNEQQKLRRLSRARRYDHGEVRGRREQAHDGGLNISVTQLARKLRTSEPSTTHARYQTSRNENTHTQANVGTLIVI
jgi:hypothetical protein